MEIIGFEPILFKCKLKALPLKLYSQKESRIELERYNITNLQFAGLPACLFFFDTQLYKAKNENIRARNSITSQNQKKQKLQHDMPEYDFIEIKIHRGSSCVRIRESRKRLKVSIQLPICLAGMRIIVTIVLQYYSSS